MSTRETHQPGPNPVQQTISMLTLMTALTAGIGINLALAVALVSVR